MNSKREKVASLIKAAFHGVTLGEKGVGLWEARAIDDGVGIAAARMNDERLDWAAITNDDLCACESSLSFADSEGIRFLLPAFLLAELEERLPAGIISRLTYVRKPHEKFAALSPAQRNAVREFLLVLRDDPNYENDRQDIDLALANYWRE